eukprot:1156886-Pelagomonas_calceolata.AAC.2
MMGHTAGFPSLLLAMANLAFLLHSFQGRCRWHAPLPDLTRRCSSQSCKTMDENGSGKRWRAPS